MKYVFNTENYHNFDMIRDNVLPPRSYFIPFGSKEKMEGIVTAEKRYRSDKVEVLNGEWDFRFFQGSQGDARGIRYGRYDLRSGAGPVLLAVYRLCKSILSQYQIPVSVQTAADPYDRKSRKDLFHDGRG